jgi:large subunit ribosomal protein L1
MAEQKTIDAVKQAIQSSKARKFKESVELSVNLKDIDLSVPKNRIEDDILLPKGRGKEVRVAIFGSGEIALRAKGKVDRIIQPNEIEEIAGDKKKAKALAAEFNFFIAEAPLMPTIGKRLGAIFAPRGKMPRPIPPQIQDITALVNNLRSTIRIRTKDRRTFHLPVGTKEMSPEDIAENIDAAIKKILGRLEKGKHQIASVYVKTTMGPAVKLL